MTSQFSSGDAIADRRADYARMLAQAGDHAAAADLYAQALELVPDWTAGWVLLGEAHQKAGQSALAVDAFRRVEKLDAAGVFGASLKLALLGAASVPETPPSAYVEGLFDDYADRFEASLVVKLNYSVPEKLFAMVKPHGPFRLTIDLGCGTGLFGIAVSGLTDRLEGFDISVNMLAKAKQKGIYHHLGQADLSHPGALQSLFSPDGERHPADLVSAADVLMYLGRLETAFSLVGKIMAPAGLFAFSVEDAGPTGAGFTLLPSLRYAHTERYVRDQLDQVGFRVIECQRTHIRTDGGKPVSGILFLSRAPG